MRGIRQEESNDDDEEDDNEESSSPITTTDATTNDTTTEDAATPPQPAKPTGKITYPHPPSTFPWSPLSGLCTFSSTNSCHLTGSPSSGFTTVSTPSFPLPTGPAAARGKWYYEVKLLTSGCIQLGFFLLPFLGDSSRGDGVGDFPSSYAYDGWRQLKWCGGTQGRYGCKWKKGDRVGCGIDLESGEVSFYLNGGGEEIGMGLAFTDENVRRGGRLVLPGVSFNRREAMELCLGT